MAIPEKNLILGTIAHYDFPVLKPFFSTLRSTNYSGDVVLFHSDIAPPTTDRLRRLGATLVPFEKFFPYLQPTLAKHLIRWADDKRISSLNIYCFRYLLAYAYLKEFGEKYQHVMLTDVRDVIFQKDPFNFPIDAKLCCFLEREGVSLGQQPINANWIELAFDKTTLEQLSDNPIACAGTTIGPTGLIIDYLEKMIDLFLKAPGKGVETAVQGIDQAMHNYLVFNGALPELRLFQNNDGPVLTLGIEDSISTNRFGLIVNKRNDAPNVVHQYDRHWQFAKRYHSVQTILRYAPNTHIPKFSRFLLQVRDMIFRR
jgi:hypothetical protein